MNQSPWPPYPKYKDSGVEWLGELPEHWEVKKLKYCLLLSTRKIEPQKSQVALENIESWTGRFIETETKFEGDGIAFEEGDILFGKLRPYLAKVFLAQFSGEAVGDFFVMRPFPTTDGRFIQYQILNKTFISIIDSSTFGAKMPRVDWEFMGNMELTLPSLSEQLAIASFLDRETSRIDTLISEKERLISLLQEYRQALISHAVTKGLDPKVKMKDSGVEWLGEVPEHWEIYKYNHIFKSGMGETILASDLPEDGGIPVLSATEDYKFFGYVNHARIILDPGDIVIPARGNSIGHVKLIHEPCTTTQTTIYSKNLKQNEVDSSYVIYVLTAGRNELFKYDRTAIPQITVDQVASNRIPIPALSEQLAIASFLDSETSRIDTLISESRTFIDLLKEYRSSLITAAVTGKIDVRGFTPLGSEKKTTDE